MTIIERQTNKQKIFPCVELLALRFGGSVAYCSLWEYHHFRFISAYSNPSLTYNITCMYETLLLALIREIAKDSGENLLRFQLQI